jgi:hypothetical protein
MARSFVASSTQYLLRGELVRDSYPLTLACWFRSTNVDAWQSLISVSDSSSGNHYVNLEIRGDIVDQLRLIVRDAAGYKYAQTTSGYSANTWHHACGVAASSTDRRVFIDGGSKGTNSEAKSFPAYVNRTGIGALVRNIISACMDGYVAEAAVWGAALTDAEVAILAKGYSPLFVRRQSIAAYWPLIRDVDIDIVGGYNLTGYNSPGMAPHPRVICPVPQAVMGTAVRITPLLLRAVENY